MVLKLIPNFRISFELSKQQCNPIALSKTHPFINEPFLIGHPFLKILSAWRSIIFTKKVEAAKKIRTIHAHWNSYYDDNHLVSVFSIQFIPKRISKIGSIVIPGAK